MDLEHNQPQLEVKKFTDLLALLEASSEEIATLLELKKEAGSLENAKEALRKVKQEKEQEEFIENEARSSRWAVLAIYFGVAAALFGLLSGAEIIIGKDTILVLSQLAENPLSLFTLIGVGGGVWLVMELSHHVPPLRKALVRMMRFKPDDLDHLENDIARAKASKTKNT